MDRAPGSQHPMSDRPPVMLTQLIGSPVVNPNGESLGRVQDLIVRLADSSGYPPVTGLKVRVAGRDLFVAATVLAKLEPGEARLQTQQLDLGRFERRPGEVLLREDILDRRLINVGTGRPIHANDLAMAQLDDRWRLVGVDPSPRGLFRRLLPPGMRRRKRRPAPLINWHDVQPFVGHVPTARLLIPLQRLKRLHPAQIADLVEGSSHEEGEEIIDAVEADPELTADVFEELDPDHQAEFLRSKSDAEAAAILGRMAPDDAADLLSELDQRRRLPVLNLMPPSQQHKLRALLQYNPSTAGGMMSPDYIAVPRGSSYAQALDRVRTDTKVPAQLLSAVFVTDQDGRVLGTVNTVTLVRGKPDTPIEAADGLTRARVTVDDELPDIALLMADFNLIAVPVTDQDGRLMGAISVDDVLEATLPDDWRRRAEASQGG
jgi:CBS domain-containing protein